MDAWELDCVQHQHKHHEFQVYLQHAQHDAIWMDSWKNMDCFFGVCDSGTVEVNKVAKEFVATQTTQK